MFRSRSNWRCSHFPEAMAGAKRAAHLVVKSPFPVAVLGGAVWLFAQTVLAGPPQSAEAAALKDPVAISDPSGSEGVAGGVRQDYCPPDSLFEQPVQTSGWSAGVSEQSLGWLRYESFSGVVEPICDIHWWGIDLAWDGDWVECTENPMPFEIRFYQDAGGLPGAEVCSYTATVTGDFVMVTGGRDLWEYDVEFDDCCDLTDGWVSIQGGGDPDCYFLWMSSDVGDASNCFDDGIAIQCGPPDHGYDLSLCLT
ncbi:MAG: hypothetical protein WBE26_12930, partial [Phycisphaerae bacterium]